MLSDMLALIYLSGALLLSAFAVGTTTLLLMYLRGRREALATPEIETYPHVVVQLPIYNEHYVVERLLNAAAALDYPCDKLTIQVLDDSTDDTCELIAERVAMLRESGIPIHHIRRETREGYKAGALAYGLTITDAEYVAVFDADFVPPPDFLKRTIPHLVCDPDLALVQGRWGHLNTGQNLLTRAVALAIDGHFIIEQFARNRGGLLMNFNGTGGVWRISAIHDSGGWQDRTLTEDMDLSYRAQLCGWKFLFLPELEVPGEVPPRLTAYQLQQQRWADGGSRCFALLIKPVWTHPRLTLAQRLMATMHLCQYLVHPVIVLLLLLAPPLLLLGELQRMPLGFLGFLSIFPPLVFVISQRALHRDWLGRLSLGLIPLVIVGMGMAWSNARGAVHGLFSTRSTFERTPKYNGARAIRYRVQARMNVVVELLLCLYTAWGAVVASQLAPGLVGYLAVYSLAFGVVALWSLRDGG